jgi:hypothetical protein
MEQKIYSGTLEALADEIGNAQYDITALHIGKIADKVKEKAVTENSKELQEAFIRLNDAKSLMDSAWKICRNKMDGECSKHQRIIRNYSYNIDELIEQVVDNPKDELTIFIGHLGYNLMNQADADSGINKHRLASCLYRASSSLFKANQSIHQYISLQKI